MDEENKSVESISAVGVEKNAKKRSNIKIIMLVISVLLIGIGCGIFITTGFNSKKNSDEVSNSKENTESQNENTENQEGNNDGNTNTNIAEDTSDDSNISEESINFVNINDKLGDTKGNIYIKGNDVKNLYINGKLVLTADPANSVNFGDFYKASDFYIVFTHGDGPGGTKIYVYDTLGNLTQKIYKLDDNNMIIADSEKYRDISFNGNKIITNATNLDVGPSLITNIDDYIQKSIYICNNEEIAKANVNDNSLVYAKYQLIFKANGKFEISRVNSSDIEKTLGQIKVENCK
jgi:hypothetical protein